MPSPFVNTFTVWHSLFLREALDRFFGSRAGWAWMIIEPALHIIFFGFCWALIRGATMSGAETTMWLCCGLLTYFLFRRTAVQSMHAIDCNKAFFAFRQVRPWDASVARGSVEVFSMFYVSLVVLLVCAMVGKQAFPEDPLILLLALAGMWLIGIGYGLISSVCMRLVPESAHILQLIMMPMYFLSGVIMPLTFLPMPYRQYLLYNPLAHGVELARIGFFGEIYHPQNVSLFYLYAWALAFVAIGMILYKLLENRLLLR